MEPDAPCRTVVIDMGSNSFRLVAYSYEPGRWWRRTDEIYDTVRLGAGLVATGRLAEDRIETAIEAMEVYAHFCAASGIARGQVIAVATSAIRDADNGAELLARVRERTGFPARVLSAEEEARYGYLAAVNSTSLRDGAVLDLGGGSLQIVAVADRLAVAERLLAARHGADDGALPRRPALRRQAARRAASPRARGAGARAVGRAHARVARRHRRHRPQPDRGGRGGGGPAVDRRAGGAARARRPRAADRGARVALGRPACGDRGHQAGALRADPRRRPRDRRGDGGGRRRAHGGHPFGPPRGRLLLEPPRGRGPAAVRRRPHRQRAQPGGPVPARPRALHARRRLGR